jgi:hypothetical protein
MTEESKTQIEAAVYRRLRDHLRARTDVQNIDLMILADFCRNCLSKWYRAEAADLGVEIEDGAARELVYGMPYDDWKQAHQRPATDEQMQAFKARQQTS